MVADNIEKRQKLALDGIKELADKGDNMVLQLVIEELDIYIGYGEVPNGDSLFSVVNSTDFELDLRHASEKALTKMGYAPTWLDQYAYTLMTYGLALGFGDVNDETERESKEILALVDRILKK